MPPITRSSIHGSRPTDELETTTSLEDADDMMDSDHEMMSSEIEGDMIDDTDDALYEAPLQSSAQELLRPLQETADRVGRQVEEFAQALDRFNSKKKLGGQELWEGTWLLMDKYSDIALQSAKRVEAKTSRGKSTQKNRKSLGDTSAQQQNLLLESDLWTLTAQLLPCKSPNMIQDTGFKQNSALAELHRYSTNSELWSAFLDVDAIANQYEMLLEWLQEWKRKTSEDLKDRNLDAYAASQRGEGLWSGGNIYTQAPIKKQKVLRAHPGPLLPNPDIRNVHVSKSSQAEILVTQMDPDARLRQDAVVESEDAAYEDAAWHACWEMLRRGVSLNDSRDWWSDRNELWRSLVTRATGAHIDEALNPTWLRIINLASNPDYLAWCRELSEQDINISLYERAVYGIIAGIYDVAIPVCKSMDDHLFSLFNELLIDRYESFLEAYRRRLQDPDIVAYTPAQSTMSEVSQCLAAVQTGTLTKTEAHQPHKYLQGMLMSDDIPSFLLNLGHAAAQMAHLTGQSAYLFDQDDCEVSENAQVAAQDEDIVRIAAHLQLALHGLGLLEDAYARNAGVMENNIINYVGLLERHAKYILMPLYTSKLSLERQPRVLGRILGKVAVPRERDEQIRLMKQYRMPVNRVIYTICDYARQTWVMQLDKNNQVFNPAKITEYHDKVVRIRVDFIGEMQDEEEVHVIQAHEWVTYTDAKNWNMAVWLMTSLYKTLLLSGRIAAARELATRVELATTSMKVTGMNLSLAAYFQDDSPEDDTNNGFDNEDENDDAERLASPTKRRKEPKRHPPTAETIDRAKLAEQSVVWAHLEHLIQALAALEQYQDLADQVEAAREDIRLMKSAKNKLSQSLQVVHHTMEPLMDPDFLNCPSDEQEDRDLTEIRNHYLPECILAYNSALYFGGHAISRQHLVQCMDLAQKVAKNDTLTQAFIASRRMQELVTAFARDSQALLRANEHHGSSRGKGEKRSATSGDRGGRLDIWQVTWKSD